MPVSEEKISDTSRELQGLRLAPFWIGALFAALVMPLFSFSSLRAMETLIVCFVAFGAIWIPWSGAWYRRRYGTIVSPARRRAPYLTAAMIVFLIIFAGSAVFSALDRYRGALNLWVVLIPILPTCFYVVPPSPLIRLRRALYIAGSVTILLFVGSVPFSHPSKWLLLSTVSSTLLILSLYDHWLLRHFLHEGTSEISSE
jgi:hypothetical protein